MRNIRATIYNKILSIIPEYTSEDVKDEIDEIAYAIKHLVLHAKNYGALSRDMIEGYAEIIARAIGDIIMKSS
jgi:U3 small nucleolar RNA-associated protein 14